MLRHCIQEFGPGIKQVRVHSGSCGTPQPLELLRHPHQAPTVATLIDLGTAGFIHWLAHHSEATNVAQHEFVELLRRKAKSLEYATLSLATWNVAALPRWLGPFTSPLTRFTHERFAAIGQRLAASSYDVVALQELWDRKSAQILTSSGYPHTAPERYTPGLIGRSGLAILSRHPILEYEERSFKSRVGVERFVCKGMLRALIELDKGVYCYVYTCHLLSPPEPATRSFLTMQRAQEVRARQVDELAEFMASGSPAIPTVVLGDFNCESGDPEYRKLKELLKVNLSSECLGGAPISTFDPMVNSWACGHGERAAALDHIWVPGSTDHRLVINSGLGQTKPDFRGKHLSDHYLLGGTVTWLKNNRAARILGQHREISQKLPIPPLSWEGMSAVGY
jgi:endonuclease/exonuclease/phosphatase family metal-dependent hydrolase